MSVMSAAASTGSPAQRRSSASKEENFKHSDDGAIHMLPDSSTLMRKNVTVLGNSMLGNQNSSQSELAMSDNSFDMSKLMTKLSEATAVPRDDDDPIYNHVLDHHSHSNSLPPTPATDDVAAAVPMTRPASAAAKDGNSESDEVLRLKLELAHAQSQIRTLDQELASTRSASQASGHITPNMSSDSEYPQGLPLDPIGHNGHNLGSMAPPSNKQNFSRDNTWSAQEDGLSESGDALSAGPARTHTIWGNGRSNVPSSFAPPSTTSDIPMAEGAQSMPWATGRGLGQGFVEAPTPQYGMMDSYRGEHSTPDHDSMMRPPSSRRGRIDNHYGSHHSFGSGYGAGGYSMGQSRYDAGPPFGAGVSMANAAPTGMGMYSQFQQQAGGTQLSPHATEFITSSSGPGPFMKSDTIATEGATWLPTTEPLNYRRLLDRNVNCNWKYIVDKIVCNNDQQASIFLQQKLKVGTPEQKYEIVEAIVAQAYPLMVNRFGNFLVQRCFEHGTPEQVIKIAEAIRGNTLNLSMDPFGCHVVQKAFDSVPEDYKAIMVSELLRRIPETVIHRYACHVWQKLFELRWTESPPQIMQYVNEALRGMWHDVALGETGSLVVQNIFENCLEDDKRPCIEEVLANIDIVAHGQFGNWCIQHICEHGAPADRSRAIDHVIRYAAQYSMDQFASKVVEKCLKIGGPEFLSRYLERVCEGRVDRPRIPLIDIASDQYGNYLIQYILTNASPQHREMVANHIRKHMVSLRGSKFGSRVGMLCTNPAVATRPGPGVGPSMARMAPGARYGGVYR